MTSRADEVPPSIYALAMTAGLLGLPFMYLLADFLAEFGGPGGGDPWGVWSAWLAVAYGVLGAMFGLLWPRPKWRWGLWLTSVPLFVVYILSPGAPAFLGCAAQSALPACSAAYAAARLHLKYTQVDESG